MTRYTTFAEVMDANEREIEARKGDHLLRVRVEEELRNARADDRWYDENPEDKLFAGGEFYHEHRGRLALLERLVK